MLIRTLGYGGCLGEWRVITRKEDTLSRLRIVLHLDELGFSKQQAY